MSPTKRFALFFDLGITAAQLSEKRAHYDYIVFRKTASELGLDTTLFEEATNATIWNLEHRLMTPDEDKNHSNYYLIGLYAGAKQINWDFYLAKNPRVLSDYSRKIEICSIDLGIPRIIVDTYLDATSRPEPDGDEKRRTALFEFIQAIHIFLEESSSDSTPATDGDPFAQLDSTPPSFHIDIVTALNTTIQEATICYQNECYLATVVLCGKIIETLMTNAYRVIFDKDPVHIRERDGQKFDMKFDEISQSLMNRSPVILDSGLGHHMRGIYTARNAAVHGNIRIPTRDDAYVIANFSRNALNRVFRYLNSLEDVPPADVADETRQRKPGEDSR